MDKVKNNDNVEVKTVDDQENNDEKEIEVKQAPDNQENNDGKEVEVKHTEDRESNHEKQTTNATSSEKPKRGKKRKRSTDCRIRFTKKQLEKIKLKTIDDPFKHYNHYKLIRKNDESKSYDFYCLAGKWNCMDGNMIMLGGGCTYFVLGLYKDKDGKVQAEVSRHNAFTGETVTYKGEFKQDTIAGLAKDTDFIYSHDLGEFIQVKRNGNTTKNILQRKLNTYCK